MDERGLLDINGSTITAATVKVDGIEYMVINTFGGEPLWNHKSRIEGDPIMDKHIVDEARKKYNKMGENLDAWIDERAPLGQGHMMKFDPAVLREGIDD